MNKLLTLSAVALAATLGLTGCTNPFQPPAAPPVTVTAEPEAPEPETPAEPEAPAEPVTPVEPETPATADEAYVQFIIDQTTVTPEQADTALTIAKGFCADLDAGNSFEDTFTAYVTAGIGEDGTATDAEIALMGTVLGAATPILCPQHNVAAEQYYKSIE